MRKTLFVLSVLVLAAMVSGEASAHGRVRFGVYVGGPYWGPYWGWGPSYYYPPPYYYYPPAPAPAQPTEYVERISPANQGWWYYCEQSRGYYPYVKECPTGWRRVAPAPPSTAPAAAATPLAPVPPAAPTPPAGPN
jgi:hypothetical protein